MKFVQCIHTCKLTASEYERQKLVVVETPHAVASGRLHIVHSLELMSKRQIACISNFMKCRARRRTTQDLNSLTIIRRKIPVEYFEYDRFGVRFDKDARFEQTHEEESEIHLVASAVVDARLVAERVD